MRSEIDKVQTSGEYFPSPSEVSLDKSLKSLPLSLVRFLSCLLDEKCLNKQSEFEDLSLDKKRKCAALAECLVSLQKRQSTPLSGFGTATAS